MEDNFVFDYGNNDFHIRLYRYIRRGNGISCQEHYKKISNRNLLTCHKRGLNFNCWKRPVQYRVRIKRTAIAKSDLSFSVIAMTKKSHSTIFALQKFVENTNASVIFFFQIQVQRLLSCQTHTWILFILLESCL